MAVCHYPKRRHDGMAGAEYRCLDQALGSLSIYSLNLVLSFQAAYTAPIILISQNRQSAIDRDAAEHDYDVNLKAELEIELLHQKLDLLREEEIGRLIQIIERLEARLSNSPMALLAKSENNWWNGQAVLWRYTGSPPTEARPTVI